MRAHSILLLIFTLLYTSSIVFATEPSIAPRPSTTFHIEKETKTEIPDAIDGCVVQKRGHLSFLIDDPVVNHIAARGKGHIVFGGVGVYDCNVKHPGTDMRFILVPTIQWRPIYGDILSSLMFNKWTNPDGSSFVTATEKIWISKIFGSLNTNIRPKETKFIKYVGDKLYFEWRNGTMKIFLNQSLRYGYSIPVSEFERTYTKFMTIGFKQE